MKYLAILLLTAMVFLPDTAAAQIGSNANGVTSFQADRESWRRRENTQIDIIQTLKDSLGPIGARNITESEQVFCYVVDTTPAGYDGYAINNIAVKSFCGALNSDVRNIVVASLFMQEDNVSTKLEQCLIRPKLMFRFIRGVDYTDVLISSPCYSFTTYYAGRMRTYNFSAGSAIIDDLVEIFDSPDAVPFVSPALLGQILPIGVPENTTPQPATETRRQNAPVRNWNSGGSSTQPSSGSGWNNLNR